MAERYIAGATAAQAALLCKKMNPPPGRIMLPVELLHRIAAESPQSYRALLSLSPFARSLDPGIIADYKIHFGHTVTITRDHIVWKYHGQTHRLDGPAIEDADGNKYWYWRGLCHREDGPAVVLADGAAAWYIEGHHVHNDRGPGRIVPFFCKK